MKKHQGHPTLGAGKPPAPGSKTGGPYVANPAVAAAAAAAAVASSVVAAAATAKHARHTPHGGRTAAQVAAEKKWQQAGTKASAAKRKGKKGQRHGKVAKWTPNADVACCAAEALAASARLAGREVTEQDVLALYWLTASHPDAGATLEATIEAAAVFGLGGARLVDARPASALRTGTVLGVDLQERHALTLDGRGVWTWGEWRPATLGLLAGVDEAWELTWL